MYNYVYYFRCIALTISLVLCWQSAYAQEIAPDDSRLCAHEAIVSTDELMSNAYLEKKVHGRSFGSLGANLNAFTQKDILGIPPDMDGSVGATQYIGIINGWIRSFNKTTGRADNILNLDLNRFFAPITNNDNIFDVRIRFDRLSSRWFMTCEDDGASNNIFIAVSDGPIISHYSKWRFFKFTIGIPGGFADYPTLGIDAQALYIGTSVFTEPGGDLIGTRVNVLPKAPFVSGGSPTIFTFNNIPNIGVAQGVNNLDPAATVGYFIGVNNFDTGLTMYRVNNPGTSPTLSTPISITIGFTPFEMPIPVPTLDGSTIDGGDDRLLFASILNNQLWTVHGLGVDNAGGSSNPNTVSRDACRWYQLNTGMPIPVIVQLGTLFMASPLNTKDQRSYIFPSLMSTGQGNMILGCTTAGTHEFINAAVACRAATDPAGTLRTPVLYTSSTTSYDNGESNRWGDYSAVALDPCDNMTIWALQEYCSAQDQWGCRLVQVLAPLPATPTLATSVAAGLTSVVTNVIGAPVNGSAF